MGGGKGGKGSTPQYQIQQQENKIPEWLDQRSQQVVQRADELSNRPYNPYTGQIVASTPQDTLQAYQQVRDMQGAGQPYFNTAGGIWNSLAQGAQPQTPEQLAANTNALYGNFQQQAISPIAGLLNPYLQQGPATAQQVANNALTIMNPFSQAVIDPALKAGQQALQQNLQQIGSQANQAGAFGGSRMGVTEGVAQSQAALGAGQFIGNMLNQGWQSALNPATQVALQGGQQGAAAARDLASLYSSGYQNSLSAAQNQMNNNTQAAMAAAQYLPQLATQQQAAMQKDASLLQTIGAAQQSQQQAELNAQMARFYEEQQHPYQQLAVLEGAISGVPYGTSSTTQSYGQGGGAQGGKNAAAGALGGAAQGAAMGSMIMPGWGTAVGAVAGGILGALS